MIIHPLPHENLRFTTSTQATRRPRAAARAHLIAHQRLFEEAELLRRELIAEKTSLLPSRLLEISTSHPKKRKNHNGCARRTQTYNRPPVDDTLPSEALLPPECLPPSVRLSHYLPASPPATPSDLHLAVMHAARALAAPHIRNSQSPARPRRWHAVKLPLDLSRYARRCNYGRRCAREVPE